MRQIRCYRFYVYDPWSVGYLFYVSLSWLRRKTIQGQLSVAYGRFSIIGLFAVHKVRYLDV